MENPKVFAGINTNVQVGTANLHVQTENFPLKFLLITNVYFGGACIYSVKWDYSQHVNKRGFEEKLHKAAEIQQRSVVKIVPDIWEKHDRAPVVGGREVELSPEILDRIDRLFILAMKLRRFSPNTAKVVFLEILDLNPNHQLTLSKLSLLSFAA
jgi:hypothetical protein